MIILEPGPGKGPGTPLPRSGVSCVCLLTDVYNIVDQTHCLNLSVAVEKNLYGLAWLRREIEGRQLCGGQEKAFCLVTLSPLLIDGLFRVDIRAFNQPAVLRREGLVLGAHYLVILLP